MRVDRADRALHGDVMPEWLVNAGSSLAEGRADVDWPCEGVSDPHGGNLALTPQLAGIAVSAVTGASAL
jgi:hypothetical protein